MSLFPLFKTVIERLPQAVGSVIARVPYTVRPGLGPKYRQLQKCLGQVETWSNREKETFAVEQIRAVTTHARNHIPFYQTFFRKNNFDPADIRNLADFTKAPIVNKQDLQAWDLESRSSPHPKRYLVNTGGSSGSPLSFYIQSDFVGIEWAHMHTTWAKLGYKQSDLKLAINAVNLAPGGGLTGLLGYLTAWQNSSDIAVIKVFVGRHEVEAKLREELPDLNIEMFMVGRSPMSRFSGQQLSLGTRLVTISADVVMSTQYGVMRCHSPQLVHHRNLKRFECGLGQRLCRLQAGELLKDIAARISLAKAPANVFISDYLRKEAEKFVPSSKPRNHVVYNGLPQALIENAPRNVNHGADTGRLLALQATAAHKDNPTLLRTLKVLSETRPDIDWHLDVAGGGDWTPFKRMAEDLEIRDRVTFHGYVDHDELGRFFQNALCLVFPSRLEGFGNPPLEAMAHQCPVVASDCTAIPEVVGDAGILVPPGKPEAFAEAILRIKDHPGERTRLIEKGLQQIKQFSWQRSAAQMIELFKEIRQANENH